MFNLFNPDTFIDGHPFADYDRMRATEPVMKHPGSADQPDFWVLSRYDDIVAVSRDGENFSSRSGFRIQSDNRASMDPEIAKVLGRFMLSMDNPEHDKYRNLVRDFFMPNALKKREPAIVESVNQHIDSLATDRELDFVKDIALNVPIRTICTILGVPDEDEDKVIEWTNAVFATDDPEFTPSMEEANRNYLAIFDYAMKLVAYKRKNPGDDVVTLVANAEIDGMPLDDTDLKSFFSNTVAAGNETTRTSLAIITWTLSQNPPVREQLIADPDLLENAIEEILRYFSPVYQMARTANTDIEVGGQLVRDGERVAMLYGAGNRDPEMFPEPDRIDIKRANAPRNLVFGNGIHHCLGHRLGRMQMRIIIGEILKRFPDYEVVGEPVFLRNNFVAAMKSLKIRLDP